MNEKDREKLINDINNSLDTHLLTCNAALKTCPNIDDEAMQHMLEILKLNELTRIRTALEKIANR